MKRRIRSGISVGMVLCLCGVVWPVEKLSTTMGEILLRNLQPGTTYQLTPMLNIPYTLNYEGDRAVTINIDSVLPDTNEGKDGFENIPDPNWIKVEPSHFEIPSSSSVHSNITIAIPQDESLRGKKYIVYLWSKASGREGVMGMGLGIKSRFLLTLASSKETTELSSPRSSYLSFKLEPASEVIKNVKPGKKIKVAKKIGHRLKVINFGEKQMEFDLNLISGNSIDLSPPSGILWGPPTTSFKIDPSTLKLNAGEEGYFNVTFQIPNEPQFYGKHFQYLVRVTPRGSGMSSGILFRLQAETVKENE